MRTLRRQILLVAFKLSDQILMIFSFLVATVPVLYEASDVSFAKFLSMRVKVQNFVLFTGLLAVWHISFSLLGLYDSKRLAARGSEMIDTVKATTLGTLFIGMAAILFRIKMIDPVFLVVFWSMSSALAVVGRFALRWLLGRLRVRNRNLRFMLIVGTNPRAVEFARKIDARPELGYRILGFVDEEWSGNAEFQKSGYSCVTDIERLPDFLRQSVVDEVVIALPVRSSYIFSSRIASLCEEQGIVVRMLSNLFDLKLARPKAEELDGESYITLYTGTPEDWRFLVKRLVDLSIALILIILLGPLFLIVALLIKLTSRGRIFFVQERLGLNKRRFSIYKFRTMVPEADQKRDELDEYNEIAGPVFKITDDTRITPIGKFLRKTSIDELPQLFNVLKGEMSLVGPRPLPVRDYEGFDRDWHRRRFSVRPGITCLWQINGRSSIPFEKWMELDMQYIDKWSLWLDLEILLRTLPAVLRGSGAA